MRSLLGGLAVLGAGAVFVGWMWQGSGAHWQEQDPHLPLAAATAFGMCLALALATVIRHAPLRGALLLFALAAGAASFMGGDLIDRARFEHMRPALDAKVAVMRAGGDCDEDCLLDSRSPLRVAFRFDGDETHWNGACYDEADVIAVVDEGYSVHPPPASMLKAVEEAMAAFGGRVHHTLHWAEHWYGCSTRP